VIGRWLIKIVLGIALLGFVAVELGSPLITRATLDGAAHDAANDAAHELFQSRDQAKAQAVAEEDVRDDGAHLDVFNIDEQGTVHVTLSKQARSYVLHKFEPTRDWYNVRVSASAVPK
jgi:Flp pilus assembly protein TadG